MQFEPLESLDELLQSAALDPSHWPAALDRLVQLTGARGAFILPLSGRVPGAPCTASAAEMLHRYFAEGWARRDHRYLGVDKMLRTGTMLDQDIVTAEGMSRSAYYREYLEPIGYRWFAGLGFRAGGETWCLALQRSTKQECFSPEEQRALLRFQGPLSRAGTLALQSGQARIDGRADAMQAYGGAAFLLDRFGKILCSTPAAESLFGRWLLRINGHLASRAVPESLALKRLVQAALWIRTRPDSEDLAPVVLRPPGLRPIVLQAQPLRQHVREFFGSASVLLLATDLNAMPRTPDSLLRHAFKLTLLESRLGAALTTTFDLRSAAASVGMGYETARTHFKAVLAKTGARNQGQFLALAAALASRAPDRA